MSSFKKGFLNNVDLSAVSDSDTDNVDDVIKQ